MSNLAQPLSNVQLEILKAFAHDLDQDELIEFKDLIAQYFAHRAIKSADKSWDEKGWTDQTVDSLLQTKLRKKS